MQLDLYKWVIVKLFNYSQHLKYFCSFETPVFVFEYHINILQILVYFFFPVIVNKNRRELPE